MSYEQLSAHAAEIQESAIKQELEQAGFTQKGGKYYGGSGMSEKDVSNAVAHAQAKFAGVADLFTPFLTMPNPANFNSPIEAMTSVCSFLNQGIAPREVRVIGIEASESLGGFDRISGLIDNWRGPAAASFRSNYLDTFKGITANQYAMALALKGALEAERAIWQKARESIDSLAHAAQTSLDSMLSCDPKTTACLLTVAGSIFAIAAAAPSMGASLAVTLTVVGEAASSAASIPQADKKEVRFGGQNAGDIVAQISKGIDELAKDILDRERVVAESMTSSLSVLSGSRDKFEHRRPALADATRSSVTGNGRTGLGMALG